MSETRAKKEAAPGVVGRKRTHYTAFLTLVINTRCPCCGEPIVYQHADSVVRPIPTPEGADE